MRASEIMSTNVKTARPDQTIADAARMMGEIDAGVLPVGDNDRLVGMITDRDIAVRAVALGKGPQTRVREVMSSDVKYCFADEEIEDIAQNMGDIQVRRLPVVDTNKRLVGILSLGDLAVQGDGGSAEVALVGIAQPSEQHRQRLDGG